MNEKIKEFAKQAWPGLPSHWWDSRDGAEAVEKFAELIVQECAVLCDNHGNKIEDARPNKDLSSAAFDCSDIIRDHFGVEE